MPAELIKAGGTSICSEIRKFINSIWNKEKMPVLWKVSIIVHIYKKADKTDSSNYSGITSIKYVHNFIQDPVVKVDLIYIGNY
jgi:hypothetical protein